MRLRNILKARQVLETLADENISPRLAYRMTKFVTKTQGEQDFYIREVQKILQEYATQSDEGSLVVDLQNIDAFNAKIAELENTEVEDPSTRFALSDLSNELKLSMKQIFPLLDFIDEDK